MLNKKNSDMETSSNKETQNVTTTGQSSERKDSFSNYGTWFKKNMTPLEIVKKCDEQIDQYQKWIRNLQQKKEENIEAANNFKARTASVRKALEDLPQGDLKALFDELGYVSKPKRTKNK